MKIRSFLKRKLPKWAIRFLIRIKLIFLNKYARISYSQDGEDIILEKLFKDKRDGFYIDVGAHHPTKYSNTCLFYKKGWKGINIDAMPGSMRLFNRKRQRDINIEAPISDKEEVLIYYKFSDPAVNSLSSDLSLDRDMTGDFKIIAKEKVTTRTLSNVLAEYVSHSQEIDFLTIDVEGLDLQVLKSNNWAKYRPRVIVVEMLDLCLEEMMKNEIFCFLKGEQYVFFAKTYCSAFFLKEDFKII